MKTETKYICEFCGASYLYKEEAFECEKQHSKPVGIGSFSYSTAGGVSDLTSKFPKYIHIKFENGGQRRYRIE